MLIKPFKRQLRRPDYAGLLPKKGWAGRSYTFWRHRVVPQIFRKPLGGVGQVINEPLEKGKVRVTWIGHAGFFVQFAQHSIVIDPNWAEWHGIVRRQRKPGLDIQDVPLVDLVLVSHAHFDHMHKKSLRVLRAKDGIIVPRGSRSLVRRLGFEHVHEVKVWDQLDFEDMQVIHTPSHHWGARFIHDTHRDYGGYLIRAGGKSIFHCGDSAYFDGFKEISRREHIDIALMPIGAYEAPSGRDVHMNPEEAVQAFLDLGAEYMIPMHYGTFPLGNEHPEEPVERLLQEADRLGVLDCMIVPAEGEGVEI